MGYQYISNLENRTEQYEVNEKLLEFVNQIPEKLQADELKIFTNEEQKQIVTLIQEITPIIKKNGTEHSMEYYRDVFVDCLWHCQDMNFETRGVGCYIALEILRQEEAANNTEDENENENVDENNDDFTIKFDDDIDALLANTNAKVSKEEAQKMLDELRQGIFDDIDRMAEMADEEWQEDEANACYQKDMYVIVSGSAPSTKYCFTIKYQPYDVEKDCEDNLVFSVQEFGVGIDFPLLTAAQWGIRDDGNIFKGLYEAYSWWKNNEKINEILPSYEANPSGFLVEAEGALGFAMKEMFNFELTPQENIGSVLGYDGIESLKDKELMDAALQQLGYYGIKLTDEQREAIKNGETVEVETFAGPVSINGEEFLDAVKQQ